MPRLFDNGPLLELFQARILLPNLGVSRQDAATPDPLFALFLPTKTLWRASRAFKDGNAGTSFLLFLEDPKRYTLNTQRGFFREKRSASGMKPDKITLPILVLDVLCLPSQNS